MLSLLLFLSCENKETSAYEGYTDGSSYYVSYETTPETIPFNEEFSVLVSVFETEEMLNQLTDITVDVDATMPAHGHGMNIEPIMTGPNDGIFQADGLLWHMEGEWELVLSTVAHGIFRSSPFFLAIQESYEKYGAEGALGSFESCFCLLACRRLLFLNREYSY